MRYVILLSLLLFEPIVIDGTLYNQIMQAAHQNMRGPEYDYFRTMMDALEQRAEKAKQDLVKPEQK